MAIRMVPLYHYHFFPTKNTKNTKLAKFLKTPLLFYHSNHIVRSNN